MADIPSKEPAEFRAGDTIKWKRSLDDYKASDSVIPSIFAPEKTLRFAKTVTQKRVDLPAGVSLQGPP